MGFSAIFHLFYVYSEHVSKWLARLDYTGIVFLIFGSQMPPIRYYLACPQNNVYYYTFISISLFLSTTVFIITLIPEFDKPVYRKWRAFMFILLGISAGIPFISIMYLS